MRNVEVKRESDLEILTYRFAYDDRKHVLYLTERTREIRPSKRHKFRVVSKWNSWGTYRGTDSKTASKDVCEEALRMFVESLKVDGEGPAR